MDSEQAFRSEAEIGGRRLWINVMWEGPWTRLANRLLAIHPRTKELRRDLPDGHWRCRLAERAERRHFAWVNRHLDRDPPKRWKRRVR